MKNFSWKIKKTYTYKLNKKYYGKNKFDLANK